MGSGRAVALLVWSVASMGPVRLSDAASDVLHDPPAALEVRLFADAEDGRLDELSLLEAALIAGGVRQDGQLARYRHQFAAWRNALRDSGKVTGTPYEQARAIFEYMHRDILRGQYQTSCNQLGRTIDQGNFNCLSATILYNCLGAEFGLPLVAVETSGHVLSRLLEDRPFDLETTYPAWFELVNNPERRAAVHPQLYGDGCRWPDTLRRTTAVQLVARIYYNQGVELFHQQQFTAAVAATRASLRLDRGHKPAQGNLLAGLNNAALARCDHGKFEQAARLLDEVRRIDPHYPPLAANDLHLHQRWVIHLCSKGCYREALALLDEGFRRRPDAELFDHGRFAVYRLWTESVLAAGQARQAPAVSTAAGHTLNRPEILRQELD